ncbi:MAG: T9SS type A sorting domain-containing protein, partial [Marinilabiliaceae bacterium]|nr:T9SS type A sorting domain-containing protein [Marinilabiliaceae bacterium]
QLCVALLLAFGTTAMADTVYVKKTATGSGDGTSWGNAMGDMQAAVDKAAAMEPRGQVYVAGYKEASSVVYLLDKTIELAYGIEMYGGFPSDGSVDDAALRPKADNDNNGVVEAWEFEYRSVINGDDKVRCITYSNTYFNNKSVVDGFYLTKGKPQGSNQKARYGGGVLIRAAGVLKNSLCIENNSGSRGGGAYIESGSIESCCMESNTAFYDGGGIACDSYAKVYNCLIIDNEASGASGGGVFGGHAINCTIVKNRSGLGGAGSQSDLTNCILWGNKWKDGTATQVYPNTRLIVNSAIEGTEAPTWDYYGNVCQNNIALNSDNAAVDGPGFNDPANNKWWLKEGSVCINRGKNDAEGLSAITRDLIANNRIYNKVNGGLVDLGCYESAFKGKASYTINVIGDYNYNGKVIEAPSVETNPTGIDLVYAYRLKTDAVYTNGLPSEVGEYVLKVSSNPVIWEGSAETDLSIKVVTPLIIWEQEFNPAIVNDVVQLKATSNTGLPVVFSIETGSADLNGNKVTFTTEGILKIKARQDASDDYDAVEKIMTVYVTGPLVNIPDANFKKILLGNEAINTDVNQLEISMTEAAAYSGELDVIGQNIEDLTGIEAFINITSLLCARNELRALDLSRNTALRSLDCADNNFSGDDYSVLMPVSSQESGSLALALKEPLVTIDVSHNLLLEKLACGGNGITHIDVSKNTELQQLILSRGDGFIQEFEEPESGPKAKLKASSPPIKSNGLQSLDVSYNLKLQILFIGENNLNALDLSHNTELLVLACRFTDPSGYEDKAKSTFEETPTEGLKSIDLSKNTKLMGLLLEDCAFTEIELSHNSELMALTCLNSDIDALDLSKNTKLKNLACWDIAIETLDLSKNTALERLDCEGTLLTLLDLSKNTQLTEVSLSKNRLASININNLHALKKLYLSNNQLTSLSIYDPKVKLDELRCRGNFLTNIFFYSSENCKDLYCSDNPLPFSELVTIKASNIHYYSPKKVFAELNEEVGYVVDYSAEVQPGPHKTVFTWFDSEQNPVDDSYVKAVEGQAGHFKFLKPGTYYCQMSNLFYNTDVITHNITISLPTSLIHSPSDPCKLRVYPNPSKGAFTIDLGQESADEVQLAIYNLSGQLIDSNSYQHATFEYTKLLTSGIYMVVVHAKGKKFLQKLVVE